MDANKAADISPFGVIINRTGRQPAIAHRDAEGYWEEFQREWSGEWVHAPANYAAFVGADPDGWEPVMTAAGLPPALARCFRRAVARP